MTKSESFTEAVRLPEVTTKDLSAILMMVVVLQESNPDTLPTLVRDLALLNCDRQIDVQFEDRETREDYEQSLSVLMEQIRFLRTNHTCAAINEKVSKLPR